MQKLSIESVISSCNIALSESSLSAVFYVCGFKNNKGVYNLSDVSVVSDDDVSRKGMQDVKFNNIGIKEFNKETIKQIINAWVAKVENDLSSKRVEVFNIKKIINVFCRYVQWGLAIGNDVRAKLAGFVIKYFQDTAISDDNKKYLKQIIKNEKDKFDSKKWGMENDPMETLFGSRAAEVISFIQ